MRALPLLLCLFAVLTGCRTRGEPSVREPAAPAPPIVAASPVATRGEFTIEADKLDTWNAIGQIAVRTHGVEYQGRAQMLDLYSLRYHGVDFFVLTKALPAAQTGNRMTTKVTATTLAGKPLDDESVARLLAHFQRELPAEIATVRARQAAERQASKATKKRSKKAP